MRKRRAITNIQVGKRDRQILECLTSCVPVLSFNQIADHFVQSDAANTRRALQRLFSLDLIDEFRCVTRVCPALEAPVVDWQPGEYAPDPYHIAHSLRIRWERLRTIRKVFYRIGPRLRQITGSPKTKLRPLQISHDHGFAEVYLSYRSRLLKPTQQWIGDIAFYNKGIAEVLGGLLNGSQKPDALVVDASGRIVKAVEFGGVYNAKRLIKFHQWCQRKEVAYEIW